ncbi:RNA polymerase sigma factor [Cohnella faecalis]|uniref:RNA polymerase sigma factor n=1 Tax=Cohnella faecalis TaxID=2315694 RepID=A0A398CIF3_9BACL|nr:RNA polymerase sigma factor [Cohnella faecalis]RIE03066.1 RNA polymerase sigma factor [Cohnella faecalis]
MIDIHSEEAAIRELENEAMERLKAVVQRYCLSLSGTAWDADDLAQEVWLKVLGSETGLSHANPEALLLRIAKNAWIDRSRREWRRVKIQNSDAPAAALSDSAIFEVEAAFQALIKHLSSLQRSVFLLRDVFGFSIAETALRLQLSEGAVKAAHHRARASLGSVRKELSGNALPLPEDEGMRAILRALATAYRDGDVAKVVQLAQLDTLEPAVAMVLFQNGLLRKASSHPQPALGKSGAPLMRMAA